jgi:hypothetical protein
VTEIEWKPTKTCRFLATGFRSGNTWNFPFPSSSLLQLEPLWFSRFSMRGFRSDHTQNFLVTSDDSRALKPAWLLQLSLVGISLALEFSIEWYIKRRRKFSSNLALRATYLRGNLSRCPSQISVKFCRQIWYSTLIQTLIGFALKLIPSIVMTILLNFRPMVVGHQKN